MGILLQCICRLVVFTLEETRSAKAIQGNLDWDACILMTFYWFHLAWGAQVIGCLELLHFCDGWWEFVAVPIAKEIADELGKVERQWQIVGRTISLHAYCTALEQFVLILFYCFFIHYYFVDFLGCCKPCM